MAHYAFLDENNIVTEVIPGRDEWEVVGGISDWEEWYGNFRGQKCVRTSYNGNIRVRYAGIGYRYDELRDAFIAPQPFLSWTFNEQSLDWQAPVPYPDDDKIYYWNETTTEWIQVNEQ